MKRQWGSVEQRPNGSWRVRHRVGGKLKSLPGSFATREEAEDALAALYDIKSSTTRSRTIKSYGPEWLEEREVRGMKGLRQERNRWATYVQTAPFADKPLRRVNRPDLNRWVTSLAKGYAVDTLTKKEDGKKKTVRRTTKRRRSRKTVQLALGLLRTFLSDCARMGYVSENVALGVKVPNFNPSTRDPWTYLELGEIDDLLGSAKVPLKARVFYAVSIYAGLRKGEVAALHWEDIVLDGHRPRVTVRYGGTAFGPPKGKLVKDVPLLLPVRELLTAWRDREGVRRAKGLVFHGPDGEPHAEGYDANFEKNLEKAGITRHVRPHDLRHTCGSHLVMGSWGRPYRLEEVRDWLRHGSVTQTERYAHLAPERLDGARAETDKHFRKARKRARRSRVVELKR